MSMGPHSVGSNVDDDEIDKVLQRIDTEEGKSVEELASETGYSSRRVQQILEQLMERGRITSTPDWRYRESRRSEA